MGAWGPDNFENDDALDVMGAFRGEPQQVMALLAKVADASPTDELSTGECTQALAAAEVVACGLGHPPASLPVDVEPILVKLALSPGDAGIATRAVERIVTRSELRDLWREADWSGWYRCIADLRRRLTARPRPRRPAQRGQDDEMQLPFYVEALVESVPALHGNVRFLDDGVEISVVAPNRRHPRVSLRIRYEPGHVWLTVGDLLAVDLAVDEEQPRTAPERVRYDDLNGESISSFVRRLLAGDLLLVVRRRNGKRTAWKLSVPSRSDDVATALLTHSPDPTARILSWLGRSAIEEVTVWSWSGEHDRTLGKAGARDRREPA